MKSVRTLLLAAALASIGAKSSSPDLNALLQSLQKALAASSSSTNFGGDSEPFVANVRKALNSGDYFTAERLLTSAKPNLAGTSAAAVDDLLAATAQLRSAAEDKALSAINAISAETHSKIAGHAPAKDFDSLIDQLNRLGLSRPYNQYGGAATGPEQTAFALRQLIVRWQDYLVQTDNGNTEAANNALSEVVSLAAQAPVMPRSELLAIQASSSARANAAAEQRLAEPRAQFELLAKKIADVLDRAKSPGELDEIIVALAKLRTGGESNYRNSSSGWNELNNRIETARRFVVRWQDYLNQVGGGGKGSQAVNILNQLAEDYGAQFLYPRSKILARINNPVPPSTQPEVTISDEEFTLENLDKLIAKISGASWPAGMEELVPRLNRLRAANAQLAVGDTLPAIQNARNNYETKIGPFALALAQLSEQLLMRAVQLQVRPPEPLKPDPKELVVDYLQRLVRTGSQSQDWQLVYRCMQVQQTLVPNGNNADLSADLAGFRLFFAGLNFERAGQFTEAVRSFLGCMRNAGPNLPVDEIGRRLAQIKSAHPDEFAVGATTPDPLDEAMAAMPPGIFERRRAMHAPQIVAPPPQVDAPAKRAAPPPARDSGKTP